MRQILIGFFFANGIIQVAVLGFNGLISEKIILFALITLPSLFAGAFIGSKLVKLLSVNKYQYLVSFLLILVGVLLIIK